MLPDRKKRFTFINSRNVFINSLLVIVLAVIGVYFWGLGQHHTFFENSILTTTILSVSFFLFITIGLYRGVKLKDTLGDVTDKVKLRKIGDLPDMVSAADLDFDGGDEGCAAILVGIVIWILAAIALALIIWIFGNVLMVVIAAFIAMLYWIFFRALRLVFKQSNKCKDKLTSSIGIGLVYTFLYNFWIYGIFILIQNLKK